MRVRSVFIGSTGLRRSWRLLIFVFVLLAVTAALATVATVALAAARHESIARFARTLGTGHLSPSLIVLVDGPIFVATLVAGALMARIEHRSLGSYGLALRQPALARALEGGAAAIVAITAVVAVTLAAGGVTLTPAPPSGTWALGWLAAFVVLALSEESTFRGYSFVTIAGPAEATSRSRRRFWVAALSLSAGFAGAHIPNPGETPAGIAGTFAFGLLLCAVTRWTGSLWFAVGFHTGWDWAETYLFGVPDSGLPAPHTLLVAHLAGPAWLTGGTAGPEGSLPTALALAVVAFYAWRRFGARLHDGPRAVAAPTGAGYVPCDDAGGTKTALHDSAPS